MRRHWHAAAITGASSSLGVALARKLAAPGRSLHFSGRDAKRLTAVAARCREAGATVLESLFDVRDAAACADRVERAGRLDLLIANAGTSGDTGDAAAQARAIFEVNLTDTLNTALPALARMGCADGSPWLPRSSPSWRPPGALAYCASKTTLQRWADAADATA